MSMDLTLLPAPQVIEPLSFEIIYQKNLAKYQELDPDFTLVLESDPIVKLLEAMAWQELLMRQRVNDAARAVMLAFSTGTDLDHMAANFNVQRLVITPADESTVPPTTAVMESATSLRDRTQQAFEGLSVAGPREAYKFHARSADGRVADASAISPSPAVVVVTILATAGDGTAPADLLDKVRAALNEENTRPLGDRLTVQGAAIVNYAINATLFIDQGPEAEPILQAALASADAYRNEQRRLGRDVNTSAIIAALHVEGVKKVVLVSPAADIAINETQAAYCTGVDIINGGVSG